MTAAADAQRSGVTAESVKAAAKARQMSLEEAEKILGIDPKMGYDEVLKVRTHRNKPRHPAQAYLGTCAPHSCPCHQSAMFH